MAVSEVKLFEPNSEASSKGAAILDILPQKPPFRYIDRLCFLGEQEVVGEYTFKEDEWFYRGHFPGNPVTPGVIQIECMAQTGVVAFGIYLTMLESEKDPGIRAQDFLTVFTDVEAEFLKEVKPGAKVFVKAKKIFWRRRKLRSQTELFLEDGTLAATARLSGMGIKK